MTAGSASTFPTGRQWHIAHGRQEAVVTEVGATLRAYSFGGADVVEGFGPGLTSEGGRGQVLAPWPNRLADGRYRFAGIEGTAAINEPERSNAIHGLVRWIPWDAEAHAQNVVVMACRLFPSPDYPFTLGLRIEYRLGRSGLSVTTSAVNLGEHVAPFGLGFHPYLTVGTPRIDSAVLGLPATQSLVLDGRALPTGEVRPVTGSELDFTTARSIGSTRMDTAFTGLRRDPDGLARASLERPGGDHGVELWVDDYFGYLMCYTGDTLGDAGRRRTGLALEPMTCPPDAFRSETGVAALEPGGGWEATWGLRPW